MESHYKQLTVVRFSSDAEYLLTGSQDATVHVWSVADLVDPCNGTTTQPTPLRTLSEHTLAITDVQCGASVAGCLRVVTASADRSCKIWDVLSGTCLATLVFPTLIQCVTLNRCETVLYAGGSDGRVYSVDMYTGASTSDPMHAVLHALPELVHVHVADTSGATGGEGHHVFGSQLETSAPAVLSLCLSMDNTMLFAGLQSGLVQVWDIETRQLLRTLGSFKGPVTNVMTLMRPDNLFQPESARDQRQRYMPVPQLKKFRSDEDHEASVVVMELSSGVSGISDTLQEEPMGCKKDTQQAEKLEKALQEKEAECERLRAQLSQAHTINEAMYRAAMDSVLAEDKPDR